MAAGDAMTFLTTEIILSVLSPNLSQLRAHVGETKCDRTQLNVGSKLSNKSS